MPVTWQRNSIPSAHRELLRLWAAEERFMETGQKETVRWFCFLPAFPAWHQRKAKVIVSFRRRRVCHDRLSRRGRVNSRREATHGSPTCVDVKTRFHESIPIILIGDFSTLRRRTFLNGQLGLWLLCNYDLQPACRANGVEFTFHRLENTAGYIISSRCFRGPGRR